MFYSFIGSFPEEMYKCFLKRISVVLPASNIDTKHGMSGPLRRLLIQTGKAPLNSLQSPFILRPGYLHQLNSSTLWIGIALTICPIAWWCTAWEWQRYYSCMRQQGNYFHDKSNGWRCQLLNGFRLWRLWSAVLWSAWDFQDRKPARRGLDIKLEIQEIGRKHKGELNVDS